MKTGFTVWNIQTGQISNAGICSPHLIALQSGSGEDYVGDFHDDLKTWMPGGVPTPRPVPPAVSSPVTAGDDVPLSGVEPGAQMTLIDAFGIENNWRHDPADPLILVDAGKYTLRVVQDFPAHNDEFGIEVVDA